jgi:hypothetical protein
MNYMETFQQQQQLFIYTLNIYKFVRDLVIKLIFKGIGFQK